MCNAYEQCTETIPLVLGIHAAYTEYLDTSAKELIHGEHLRVHGELWAPTTTNVNPATFIQQLRRHKNQPYPIQIERHSSRATFIHKDFKNATHFSYGRMPYAVLCTHHIATYTM